MISQSLSLAKRRATESGKLKFSLTKESEIEDVHYQLEWLVVIIQGTEEQEQEEYDDTMKLYGQLKNTLKKEIPKDDEMLKFFKTKMLNEEELQKAYKEGYGSMEDNNIANKMLELGILTSVVFLKDYDTRTPE